MSYHIKGKCAWIIKLSFFFFYKYHKMKEFQLFGKKCKDVCSFVYLANIYEAPAI